MQLHPHAENSAPEGAICETVRTSDGKTLRALRAVVADPRGTVVVIGGRGDFMERYFETMKDFMARGYCVASLDVRGQGGSERLLKEPNRGHIGSFAAYDEDMRAFMTQVVFPHCPGPFYAVAHSTGGAILLRVLRARTWFRKAIVLSPLIGLVYGLWPRPVVACLVTLMNWIGLGRWFLPGQLRHPMPRSAFAMNPLTTDERRWNRDSTTLEKFPQLGIGGPTFGWLRAARKSTGRLQAMRPSETFNCPVLIVEAGLDRVVSNRAIRAFVRRLPGVALVSIPGAKHEILSERDEFRDQFLAAFDSLIADG